MKHALRNGVIALVAFAALAAIPVIGQEPSHDQVGVVVPAFDSEGSIGLEAAYAIKNAIQAKLASKHPRTGDQSFGFAIAYFVPKPLRDESYTAAVGLAQGNGLQATIWGTSYQLSDGIAIEPHLAISPEYEDYRELHQEYWAVDVAGTTVRLGPPALEVSFAPATFSEALVRKYGDVGGIAFCRQDGSGCGTFSDYSVTRLMGFSRGHAIVRRGGTDYYVDFSSEKLMDAEVTMYAAMALAYFRGNFYQVVDLASAIARHPELYSTTVRIDALLYSGAARARLGNAGAAAEDFAMAAKLNPIAQRVLRFEIMADLSQVAAGDASRSLLEHWSRYRDLYGPAADAWETAVDKVVASLPR